MARVLRRAVRDRERPLRDDLVVGYGLTNLRVTAEQSRAHRGRGPSPVPQAQRRPALRRGRAVRRAGPQLARRRPRRTTVRDRLRRTTEVREALERMWPVLTPAQLLHDLYGSHALLHSAAGTLLSEPEWQALHRRPGRRPRGARVDQRRRAAARRGPRAARSQAPVPQAARRRGRRCAHLRPHRGRRGPGPLADAAAGAQPPLAQRVDDHRRRHRPVHRRVGPRQLAGDPRAPARPP